MAKTRRAQFEAQLESLFDCVVAERCVEQPTLQYLAWDNQVGGRMPPNSSYFAEVETIASSASIPIPIDWLSQELEHRGCFARGNTIAPQTASHYINTLAFACGLRWWITEKGLVIDHFTRASNLSDFDAVAGRLMLEYSQNGRLKKESLVIIAKTLDEAKFPLKEHIQESFWSQMAEHNIRSRRKVNGTFEDAIKFGSIGPRAVRRALYDARDRFLKSGRNIMQNSLIEDSNISGNVLPADSGGQVNFMS
jgi:hypothetical protein